MRFALVNPNWTFNGSVYFGCREPHFPLELAYGQALLEEAGHEACLLDGHLFDFSPGDIRTRVQAFNPDITVIQTAPTSLFWRCPQPELTVPMRLAQALRGCSAKIVAVGPHGSASPGAVLRKLGVDGVIRGECEQILPLLAQEGWERLDQVFTPGHPQAPRCGSTLPDALLPLSWPKAWIDRHSHHHHRFDRPPQGPGAEIEASRGCPYQCSFCAKDFFRGKYRKRPMAAVLTEIDGLIAQGVQYLYFIDEIFLPDADLLNELSIRPVSFGIQTRIDLWEPELLEMAGTAGCVSIESGIESITEGGRMRFDKRSKLSTAELVERLIHAKRFIPFVQANLLKVETDDNEAIQRWRDLLREKGVWANDPVPLFPFPGSPEYRQRWGEPDDQAWERAHADYLDRWETFCDLQEEVPLPIEALEQEYAYA
ncbi:MAG: TIGR04295 family B12-binding domain-containing radical SAM protein [Desulfovibrionales bacterium]